MMPLTDYGQDTVMALLMENAGSVGLWSFGEELTSQGYERRAFGTARAIEFGPAGEAWPMIDGVGYFDNDGTLLCVQNVDPPRIVRRGDVLVMTGHPERRM